MWLRTGAAVSQLLAGVLLLVPRTRAIGGVGIFTIMVSAGTIHAMLGHNMLWATLYCGAPALAAAAVAWMSQEAPWVRQPPAARRVEVISTGVRW